MKDAYEVLYQKEADLARVRQEVESLRIAASLLNEDASVEDSSPSSSSRRSVMSAGEASLAADLEAAATGTDGPPTSQEAGFWKSLKSRRR
jgi:hypothetical protein